MAPKRGPRIASLDVTRACAATAVFLFHYGAFPFGYLGVELFFLLSGFVLTLPSRHDSIFQFARARCVRLYPAYWTALVLTLCVILWKGERPSLVAVAANATMLTAFLGQRYIDGVYWSLTEEIIFYLLVGLTGSYRKSRNPLVLAATMAFACLGYATITRSGLIDMAHNSKAEMAIKYFPFFSCGIAAATLFRKFGKNESFPKRTTAAAFALCAAVPPLTYFYGYSTHLSQSLSGYEQVAISCVFLMFYALIIAASFEHRFAEADAPSDLISRCGMALVRGIAFFGACTYPFYLLHERFTKTVAELMGFTIYGPWDLVLLFLAVTVLSVAIHL